MARHPTYHLIGMKCWDASYHQQTHSPQHAHTLTIKNGRIVADKPTDALIIDLTGYTLIPALINGHDHLELNHYPRTKFRDRYANAHIWGDDVNQRLGEEPYDSLRQYTIADRLFIGGIKNLLSGTTRVIQHGAPHRHLFRRDFPVRVLPAYGWAHSLHFSTETEVIRSYESTPAHIPWFIHLAEGTDDVAREEYQRLKALGCLGKNTVLIHAVGLDIEDIVDASRRIRGVVYCGTTNHYLLGASADVDSWMQAGLQFAIGSDSRLTADGDLLDEIGALGTRLGHIQTLNISLQSANWLWGDSWQPLTSSSVADFFLVPDDIFQSESSSFSRNDIALVVRDGMPMIGDPTMMRKFSWIQTVSALLDGKQKHILLRLAKQMHHCQLNETGFIIDKLPKQRLWFYR